MAISLGKHNNHRAQTSRGANPRRGIFERTNSIGEQTMNERVRKYQVIKMLEDTSHERIHTFRKTWMLKDGQERFGWWIATLYGWKHVGDTLAECQYNLELIQEMEEQYREEINR
jgi:hypothetical protein